jgi:hypothetical protein
MITIDLDTSRAQARLQGMADRIKEFGKSDIPAELTAWEVEDMHRKYPNTETPDDHSAETEIWPTSRLALARRAVEPSSRRRVVVWHRPILREALWLRLRERMVTMMQEKLPWR